MDQDRHLIYSFPKNEREEIQIALRTFKERQYIDLRLWFYPPNETVLKPTTKGIVVALALLPELRKGFDHLVKVAEKMGPKSVVHAQE